MHFVFFFLILALAIIARAGSRKVKLQLYMAAVLCLLFFCAFRDGAWYPDILNYYDYFKGQYGLSDENFGWGYKLLNNSCRSISNEFQLLLIVISIIVVWSYTKFIKDYSPMIWLSLLLYMLINYYPSFFLLRQYLAIAIALFSIKFVINRNPIKFGIVAILAFSFHASAILIVPLYFLYGIKNTRLNMVLLSIGIVATIDLFYSFQDYVNLFSAYYAHYFETEVEEAAWQRAVLKIYITVVYLYTMKRSYYDEGINRIVFYGMILNVAICVAAMNIFSAHRLREYFAFADFVGVPLIIDKAKSIKGLKKTVVLLLSFIYIVVLAITFYNFIMGNMNYHEYQFFWKGSYQ